MDDASSAAIDKLFTAVNNMSAEVSLMSRRLDLLATTVDTLSWRNIIQLDQEMVAVSNVMGWLVIPKEEFWLLIHFANGIGTHEPGTVSVLEAIIRSGDTVIDVGAHIGLLSLPMARLIGPEGRLIALEPEARAAECLRRTLSSNGMASRSQVLEAAASNEDALVDYFIGSNSMMGSLVQATDGQASIPVKSAKLDNIVPVRTRVDVVKIDAEGFETKVFQGMKRLVSDNPHLFVIAEFGLAHLDRFGINPQSWFETFVGSGLNCFVRIDESTKLCTRMTIEELASPDNFKTIPSFNVLFYAHDNKRQDALSPLLDSNRS